MGKQMDIINEASKTFIEHQKIFFVGTAAAEGKVNVSPKGMDSLRVLGENRVLWLNLTGSGNETAAHLLNHNRITLMFCAFEGKPLILRVYGKAKVYHKTDAEWDTLIGKFPSIPGARQLIDIEVDMVQHSCGFAVPFFDYKEERSTLKDWAVKKGEEGIAVYQQEKNTVSLDGNPTGLPV